MALVEINWKRFLQPDSVPPPDVLFTFLDDQQSDSESDVLEDPAESSGTSPVGAQTTVSSQLTSKGRHQIPIFLFFYKAYKRGGGHSRL